MHGLPVDRFSGAQIAALVEPAGLRKRLCGFVGGVVNSGGCGCRNRALRLRVLFRFLAHAPQ